MLSITAAQLDVWLATLMFPMVRVLAFISTSPIIGNKQIPRRVKVGLAMLISIVIAPTLGAMPAVAVGSPQGLLIVVQQIIIGTAMGLTLRMIFNAFEMAGELAGLQMGLGFASFYDPQNSAYTPVIAQWLGITASLAFLALNGHLAILSALAESFHTLPVGEMMAAKGYFNVASWGGKIFSYGVQIALPLLAALLITNLALGILTRAAQQLNPFAIGFPITLGIGFFILSFTLPYLPALLDHILQDGVGSVLGLLKRP